MDEALFRDLETRLLDPAVRASREAVQQLLAEDFVEFASSGEIFDRPAILEALAAEAKAGAPPRMLDDFRMQALSPDAVLVTYRSETRGKRTLRSSIWKKIGGRWQMLFHQGTISP
jgi:hypothetical protein